MARPEERSDRQERKGVVIPIRGAVTPTTKERPGNSKKSRWSREDRFVKGRGLESFTMPEVRLLRWSTTSVIITLRFY